MDNVRDVSLVYSRLVTEFFAHTRTWQSLSLEEPGVEA